MPAAAAGFFFELDLLDRHAAVDAFAHVVYGECSDADSGECFHFDAGFAVDLGDRFDAKRVFIRKRKVDRHRLQRKRMAQWNEVGRAFGGHDAGQSGDFEHVAFGELFVANASQSFGRHLHAATGPGDRRVTGLSPTSTMRLAPVSSKWVKSLMCALDSVLAAGERAMPSGDGRDAENRAEAGQGHVALGIPHVTLLAVV